jgi:putative DNA primase/helicase
MNSYQFNISGNTANSAHPAPVVPTYAGKAVPLSWPASVPTKAVASLPYNRGARRPFKHAVTLPGQQPTAQLASSTGSVPPSASVPVNATATNTTAVTAASGLTQANLPPTGVGSAIALPTDPDKFDKRATELKFFEHLMKSGKFGKRDGQMHRWTGSHWNPIDGDQGLEMAMIWLQEHHPQHVNKSIAKSCFESATILTKALCEQNRKRCVIPLRNVYLEVTDKGKILMHKPNPSFGLTYVLDIGLPLIGTSYTPAAVPAQSLFGQFLKTSLPDQGVQDYLQEGMGYTLTPFTIHQVALVLKGSGCNGKSVMVRILSALHGCIAAMDLKNLKKFGLTKLVGASLAFADEVPERGLDIQTFKALVSGDPISIDRKYISPINYRSTAKWVLCTNLDQRSDDNSDGFWRRMVVIPFSEQIARKDIVPGLDEKIIETELRVVLDWCLAGLQRLMIRGSLPPEPQAVMHAKKLAITASDPVAGWVQDHGVQVGVAPGEVHTKDDVFKRYCNWCSTNKVRTMDSCAFWSRLRKLVALPPDSQHRVGGARSRYVQIRFESDAQVTHCVDASTPFDEA